MDYVLQTILQRKINVAMKLGNRQDLLQPAPGSGFPYSRISGWLRDAYIEVMSSRAFEYAEETLQFQTVQGQDSYVYPPNSRALKAISGYRSDGTPVQVSWKDIGYIRRYNIGALTTSQPLEGPPSIYTIFNNQIIFRPTPDNQPYTFYLDIWEWPDIQDDANLDTTVLQVPMDWLEIIDYLASVRGHAELGQADKCSEVMKLLYGYTDPSTGGRVAGMIERAQNRQQASSPWTDWGIQPSQPQQAYTR